MGRHDAIHHELPSAAADERASWGQWWGVAGRQRQAAPIVRSPTLAVSWIVSYVRPPGVWDYCLVSESQLWATTTRLKQEGATAIRVKRV